MSDSQVDLDGVQHCHPVGVGLSSRGLLAVHVEENGQEVLGEATQLGLFLLFNDKNMEKVRQGRCGSSTARRLCVCESHRLGTGGAALVDEDAQGVAGGEPQVGSLVDGGAEHAGHAFEGRQQVHGTRAEAREHGPNLGGGGWRNTRGDSSDTGSPWQPQKRSAGGSSVELPAAATSRRLWLQASVPLAPVLQLGTDGGGTVTTTY